MSRGKKVPKIVRLQIPAGKAAPAPPVGPALGQAGIKYRGIHKRNFTLVGRRVKQV